MKTEMKELDLNEMEQVNGGCVWCVLAVVVIAGMGAGFGHLAYQQAKNGK